MTNDDADAPEVDTAAGRVRGFWRGSSAAFLGIPFAEPPVGDLRFAAPVPARPWSGVRDATQHGPTAQRTALSEITLIPEPSIPGESTLNVDVYTPSPSVGDALPVLVWVHGGGYVAGSPASPWYDGRSFNRDGVVTVCVSYRLGFDGFGWIEGAPSNRAVRDWLLALEWVQTNIAAFGGDPLAGHHRRPVGGWRSRAHAARDGGRPAPLRSGLQPVRSDRRRPRGEGAGSGPRPGRAGRGRPHARGVPVRARGPAARAPERTARVGRAPRPARSAGLAHGRPVVRTRRGRRPAPAADAGVVPARRRGGQGARRRRHGGRVPDRAGRGCATPGRPAGGGGAGEDRAGRRRRPRVSRGPSRPFDLSGGAVPAHRPGVPQSGAGHRRRAAGRAYLALPVRVRLTDPGSRDPLHRRAVLVRLPGLRPRHRAGRPAAAAGAGRRDPRRRRRLRDARPTPAGRRTRASAARSWSSATRRGSWRTGTATCGRCSADRRLSRGGPRGDAARPR